MKLAGLAGMKKATVALVRKLAVILHRMWASTGTFDADKASGCMRAAVRRKGEHGSRAGP